MFNVRKEKGVTRSATVFFIEKYEYKRIFACENQDGDIAVIHPDYKLFYAVYLLHEFFSNSI